MPDSLPSSIAGVTLTPTYQRNSFIAFLLIVLVIVVFSFSFWLGGLLSAGSPLALRVSQPDFSLQHSLGKLSPGIRLPSIPPIVFIILPVQLMISSLIFTPALWGEEFGWRGYLQIRLLSRWPLLAAVSTGLIWGVWHYPLILMGYERYENVLVGLLIFPVSTILLSIIFGWLRLRTGSVWSTSLAHAATNAVGGSLTLLLFVGSAQYTLVSYLGVLAWVPWEQCAPGLSSPDNSSRRQYYLSHLTPTRKL